MSNFFEATLNNIPFLIKTKLGEYACLAQYIPLIVEEIVKYNWIILGGDVLNLDQTPTYDNWYYNPNLKISLQENVRLSAECCLHFSNDYLKKNGSNFYFVFVISDSFISGKM